MQLSPGFLIEKILVLRLGLSSLRIETNLKGRIERIEDGQIFGWEGATKERATNGLFLIKIFLKVCNEYNKTAII